MGRAMDARDIALGLVVTGARAGVAAGRVALLPARAFARVPVVRFALEDAGEHFASEGRKARARGRLELEDAAGSAVAAREVERAVDRVLEGPLTDAVARSLAQHRVVERVVGPVAASPEFEDAVADALEHEASRRVAERALASPGLERIVVEAVESRLAADVTDRIVHSDELQRAVEEVASSAAVRAALAQQTTSLGEELVGGLRRRTEVADDAAERKASRWLGRTSAPARESRFAGLATRGVAFAFDLLLALTIFLTGAALGGLAAALVGDPGPGWFVGLLLGAWWTVVAGVYFVLFWSAAGQTPGMRLMRIRIAARGGAPPSAARATLRLLGLLLAIAPLFLGFLPILFDGRRRGLQDFLAGTTVIRADLQAPVQDAATLEAAARLAAR
jgi:uncharacterized RDD family membrane protein YckC